MGRAGIYKSEVIRARERLLAQGKNPSIDAIRIELGNTGSRTTISRYLREILEEEAEISPAPDKPDTSEAILALVRSLAGQLESDAGARLEAARAEFLQAKEQLLTELESSRATALRLEGELRTAGDARSQLENRVQTLEEDARQAALAYRELRQREENLDAQLAASQRHIQSIEEKHEHARQALEHFRQAAREQREQEARQHEQQVQYLQGEIRSLREQVGTLNEARQGLLQEKTRLLATQSQHEAQAQALETRLQEAQRVAGQIPALQQEIARQNANLAQQQEAGQRQHAAQQTELQALRAALTERQERIQALELTQMELRSGLHAKDEMLATLRELIERLPIHQKPSEIQPTSKD